MKDQKESPDRSENPPSPSADSPAASDGEKRSELAYFWLKEFLMDALELSRPSGPERRVTRIGTLTARVRAVQVWSCYLDWCREERMEPVAAVELMKIGKLAFPSLEIGNVDGERTWCGVRRRM